LVPILYTFGLFEKLLMHWGVAMTFCSCALSKDRGVATEWIGVDMSTPLLPGVALEVDASPVS